VNKGERRYGAMRILRFGCITWSMIALTAAYPIWVLADPQSDFFQPDIFGTDKALHKRTQGLTDPQGQHCYLSIDPMSLSDIVELALCRNPATRSAWAAARQQAAALGQAESAWLPTISGAGSESRTLGGTHVDVLGDVVPGPQDTKDLAVTLAWTLYDFGGRTGKIKNARYLLDASAATLNRIAQQVVFNTVQAFYGVVANDALLAAAKTTEDVSTHSLEIANALRNGGVATLADVLQAEKTAHGTLANVIGAPADQPLKLQAEPVPAEVPAFTAQMGDLMDEAVRQRPDLAAALAQRDAAEANITVARALGRPSISFQGGHQVSDVSGIPSQSYNTVGVYLTVPIFTGFNVGYGVRQAQAQLAGQEASADQVRLAVSLDVWTAYYALVSANQQLGATAKLTKTADSNQDVALGRYKSGVGTIIDVLTAQTAAATARQLRISAELSWKVSRAQLALALGTLTGADPLAGTNALP
jgi:outer membrane protein